MREPGFAELLHGHQVIQGIGVAELAQRLGVSEQQVRDYLHGRSVPGTRTLRAVASELRISVERVLDAIERQSEEPAPQEAREPGTDALTSKRARA